MKRSEHYIDLAGPGCHGKLVRPGAVGTVLRCVEPVARDTVRMSALHCSRMVGRPWKELSKAWDIRYAGHTRSPQGGTRLVFAAPSLQEAAPGLFEQGMLFEDGPKPQDTAFDLIAEVLRDVSARRAESTRFDAHLLGTLTRFGVALRRGIQSMTLGGDRLTMNPPPLIDKDLTASAAMLVRETPKPKRVRISGKLDMIRASDRAFELILNDGERLRALWVESTVAPLHECFGRPVLVEGMAVFRASGTVLRVDAEAIAPLDEVQSFFSKMPEPVISFRKQLERSAAPTRGQSGFAAIYGKWPGDETEKEMLAALEEIS